MSSTSIITNITTSKSFKTKDDKVSFEGYLLFHPEHSKYTYLINKDKQVVHKWSSKHTLGLPAYLLEHIPNYVDYAL